MFVARCSTLACRNALVISRSYWPCSTANGISAYRAVNPGLACWTR